MAFYDVVCGHTMLPRKTWKWVLHVSLICFFKRGGNNLPNYIVQQPYFPVREKSSGLEFMTPKRLLSSTWSFFYGKSCRQNECVASFATSMNYIRTKIIMDSLLLLSKVGKLLFYSASSQIMHTHFAPGASFLAPKTHENSASDP